MHATTVVDLPAGDLVDCHDFARAVARFRYPAPEEGATGMACITGSKMVDYSFRAKPKISVLEPQCNVQQAALDLPVERFDPTRHASSCPPLIAEAQLPLPVPGAMSVLSFPVALTDDDRSLLEALLDVLPPLKYPLSNMDRQLFLASFREKVASLQLVGAQCWEPILVPDRDAPELAALGEAFAKGLVDIVDQAKRPVETFDTRLGRNHYFVSRQQAITVLQQRGFSCSELGADVSLIDNQRSHDADVALEEGEPRKRWTLKRAKEMHERYLLDADSAAAVANQFGIGVQRMHQIFTKYGLPTKTDSGRPKGEKTPKHQNIPSASLTRVMSAWGRKVD